MPVDAGVYEAQVQLLLKLLNFVDTEEIFALKGGTALNLFVRDFPRLSVDIDLVYLPLDSRETALTNTKESLDRIALAIQATLPNTKVIKVYEHKNDALRLVVSQNSTTVKIELSPVLRGSVHAVQRRTVVRSVEEQYGFAELNVLSFYDLYAGKICAALDRQHPRDLYDVYLLLENEGLEGRLFDTLLVYLISHSRPVHELLDPHMQPIDNLYKNEFEGMVFTKVPQKG